mgnify:CR=1 FL=1
MEDLILHSLSNIGFPAAVCFYTLYGVNRTLKELTAAINKLSADFDKANEHQRREIDKLKDELKEIKLRVERSA